MFPHFFLQNPYELSNKILVIIEDGMIVFLSEENISFRDIRISIIRENI